MYKTRNLLGFTLVELIVVITIVGILSTVGFVSYSGYLSGARDSNRMSQLTKISDSLQVYAATKSLPLPDNYVEIQASGSTIAYQGEVGVDVLETIDYTNGGTDPKDDSYYTYYLTKDRKSIQLMALMEEQSSVVHTNQTKQFNPIASNTYAVDYTDRFPKVYGRKLGTLTQVDTNTPIQQLSQYQSTPFDVVNESTTFVAHISDTNKLEGTGAVLKSMKTLNETGGKPFYCKDILASYTSAGDGIYTIYSGGNSLSVYCDMTTDGGGWTLVASDGSTTNTTELYNLSSTPTKVNAGMVQKLVDAKLKDISTAMRVVSVASESDYEVYDITEAWLGDGLSLKNMEYGYLYASNRGFAGGKEGVHKCNYSIMVIGTGGCTTSLNVDYPANGSQLNALKANSTSTSGSQSYSWHFTRVSGGTFRLGWRDPTGYRPYYDTRIASYLMIR